MAFVSLGQVHLRAGLCGVSSWPLYSRRAATQAPEASTGCSRGVSGLGSAPMASSYTPVFLRDPEPSPRAEATKPPLCLLPCPSPGSPSSISHMGGSQQGSTGGRGRTVCPLPPAQHSD